MALDEFLFFCGHVVAEEVEAEFVVGAVSNVAIVSGLFRFGWHAVFDHADGEAEVVVEAFHPFTVAGGEVFVDGDDENAFFG